MGSTPPGALPHPGELPGSRAAARFHQTEASYAAAVGATPLTASPYAVRTPVAAAAATAEISARQETRSLSPAVATIDLGAVRKNYRLAVDMLSEGTTPSAVVKANAYGMGALELTKTLVQEGCKDFFVARGVEARDLRVGLAREMPKESEGVAIFLLDGVLKSTDPELLIKHKITPVLNSIEQVERWNQAGEKAGKKLPAVLQVNTGMNRAGMPKEDLAQLLEGREALLKHIDVQLIMSHLAKSDELVPPKPSEHQPGGAEADLFGPAMDPVQMGEATRQQLAEFNAIAAHFPGVRQSIGASSTVFLGADVHKDMVRLGGTFHGQTPYDHGDHNLSHILELKTEIGQTFELPPGQRVGYGLVFEAQEPMRIATLPIGYADLLPRIAASNAPGATPTKAHVLIGGHKAEVVGKTSMDMLTVNVTHVPPEASKEGASVTIMGDGLTPDQFGAMYGTNPSEAITKMQDRVFRDYVDAVGPPAVIDPTPSRHAWPTEHQAQP